MLELFLEGPKSVGWVDVRLEGKLLTKAVFVTSDMGSLRARLGFCKERRANIVLVHEEYL